MNQPRKKAEAIPTMPVDGAMRPPLDDDGQRVQARLTTLFRQYQGDGAHDPTVVEALTELQNTLEELQVAQGQLRQQNRLLYDSALELQEERARYHLLFDLMPDAYFVTSRLGRIQEANRAASKILNRSVDWLIGKPLIVHIPVAERDKFRRHQSACLESGGSCTWETELLCEGARPAPVEVHLVCSRPVDRHAEHLRWLMRDISERRRAQQSLVQAERLGAIGQMVAGLAHESRNALQRSQACLSMLALEVKDRPEANELIERLRGAQRRLVHLYEQVRAYAAPVRMAIERVDLIALLQEVLDDLLFVHQGRLLRLVLSGDQANPPVANVDRMLMSQIVTNIVENSIAACGDPVVIEFDWVETDIADRPMLRLQLRDNGPGLDQQIAARLFEPFFTTKTRGTGLGMSIVRRLVESHGGSIEVGRIDGQGTELVITLPR